MPAGAAKSFAIASFDPQARVRRFGPENLRSGSRASRPGESNGKAAAPSRGPATVSIGLGAAVVHDTDRFGALVANAGTANRSNARAEPGGPARDGEGGTTEITTALLEAKLTRVGSTPVKLGAYQRSHEHIERKLYQDPRRVESYFIGCG
jgi:hypothetical protein